MNTPAEQARKTGNTEPSLDPSYPTTAGPEYFNISEEKKKKTLTLRYGGVSFGYMPRGDVEAIGD